MAVRAVATVLVGSVVLKAKQGKRTLRYSGVTGKLLCWISLLQEVSGVSRVEWPFPNSEPYTLLGSLVVGV